MILFFKFIRTMLLLTVLSAFLCVKTNNSGAQYACIRSPTVGSPINYIHKGLEQIYAVLYNAEVGAIPRMILDYTDIAGDMQHYGWYFPSSQSRAITYLSLGQLQSQRPSLENLFYTEVDDSGNRHKDSWRELGNRQNPSDAFILRYRQQLVG